MNKNIEFLNKNIKLSYAIIASRINVSKPLLMKYIGGLLSGGAKSSITKRLDKLAGKYNGKV